MSEAVEFDGEYIPVTVYYFRYENGVLTSLYKVEEDENSASVFKNYVYKNYVYEDGSYTVSVYRDDTLISEETFDGNIPENEVPQN